MGYTAMNVGTGEFFLGMNFLREKSADLNFPLVVSNLSYAESATPFTKKYVITQAGSLKVAILGIMSPGILDKMPRSETSGVVEVIPPGEALESLLPRIRKDVDIVILLSQLGLTETKKLVDGLEGVDLAIYGGEDNKPAKRDEEAKKPGSPAGKPGTPVLKASSRGFHLGYVRLSVGNAGRVAVDNKRMIFLNNAVAMDDNVLEITGDDIYKKIAREKKKAEKEQRRQIEELHKLTPMEYMEKLLKEQSKGGTNQ
jgi:2',3'-cyclic-nucleotide 2'-phosphodiesterase (5'-nucleotidase family)